MFANGNQALREYAFNAGMDNPEKAWILTPWDVWMPNPHYDGPEVQHPEEETYCE
jgi:hypothetical protein